MIVTFRLFEKLNQGEPEVGDYVLCSRKVENWMTVNKELNDFFQNNIGRLDYIRSVKVKSGTTDKKFYNVAYDVDLESEKLIRSQNFWLDEIIYWSKDKEDLEEILSAKKYNL